MSDVLDLFGLVSETPTPTPTPTPRPVKTVKPPGQVRVEPPVAEPAPPVAEPAPPVAEPEPTASKSKTATRGARFLDCGHLDWSGDGANEAAREQGHCCANHRHQISWTHLRGAFVRPLPLHYRRTVDKERGPGFPGYCCDDKGFYIGGIANDCRHYGTDDRRCPVHGAPRRSVFDEDEAVDQKAVESVAPVAVAASEPKVEPPTEPTPTPTMPPLPKATGSWKQRQMSAKTRR